MFRVVLTLAFLVVPLLEIFVIISIGQVIGGWQTVGLLLAMSVLGTYLVRREGASTWRELQRALTAGRIPSRELADAALVLVGGTLLLTPGFLTDIVGFFLIVPFTRPLARRLLTRVLARRLTVVGVGGLSGLTGMGGAILARFRSPASAKRPDTKMFIIDEFDGWDGCNPHFFSSPHITASCDYTDFIAS